MFDPTIYENIKVVVEGEIYDKDLSGEIHITDREDLVSLTQMSRKYMIQFKQRRVMKEVLAEIILTADTKDLANEVLERNNDSGVEIIIRFLLYINEPRTQCEKIIRILNTVWNHRPTIEQKISFLYQDILDRYLNEVTLNFNRKINENNIEDIHELIYLTIKSLKKL